MKLKAYAITWNAFPSIQAIYAAETAGKAKYLAFLNIQDLQRTAKIIDLSAHRAPKYDDYANNHALVGKVFQSDPITDLIP